MKNLIADKSISGYTNFVTSSNATDLDKKFSDALGSMVLDVEDKTTLIISWKGMYMVNISAIEFSQIFPRINGFVHCPFPKFCL